MKYSQIKRENELKEGRYYILTSLKELDLINEPEFKSYATMIVKMYEWSYYDEYEHLLEEIEEKALTSTIELIIQLIDEEVITHINNKLDYLIKSIEVVCIEKRYINLADSLLELEGMME